VKAQLAVVGGLINNKNNTAQPDKTQCILTTTPDNGWCTLRGLSITGDCANNISGHDHYIYSSGYSNKRMYTAIHAFGSGVGEVDRASYFMNGNASSGIEYQIDMIFTADNRVSECDYYIDMANVNNSDLEAWFANSLHSRNYAEISRDFAYYTQCHSATFLHNIYKALKYNGQYTFMRGLNTGGLEDYDIYGNGNIVYHGRLNAFVSGYTGDDDVFEMFGNDAQNTDDETGRIRSDTMTNLHFIENNYHNPNTIPLCDVIDQFDASTPDLATLNTRIFNASGFAVACTENAPDWQDAANDNFLPVGFESLAPTVNTQPETTETVVDGGYLTVSADFDQATSHQWQKDNVNIVGETSPVLTIKVVTADNGSVYRCVGTNAAGSTNSNGCTLTVGAATNAPVLSGTFNMVDTTAGTEFNYDVSGLATGGDAATAWQLTGTPPTNAVISAAGVITGTSVEETLAGNSYGVTASNAGGTSNELLDADGITVSAAASSVLTLNGVDADILLDGNIELLAGDTITFTFNCGSGDNITGDHYMMDVAAIGPVRARFFLGTSGTQYKFTEDITATVDGVAVISGELATAEKDDADHIVVLTAVTTVGWGRIGSQQVESSFYKGIIKDVTVVKGGNTTTWAINSGSVTTESPTIDENGFGDLNFRNVVAGDWS